MSGFWKEEPNFRQALRQTSCRTVYVVPNFISSGYFTEQIIPRELGLTGPITKIGEQDVYYCQPVGLSPAMTEVLLQRAREVVAVSKETMRPQEHLHLHLRPRHFDERQLDQDHPRASCDHPRARVFTPTARPCSWNSNPSSRTGARSRIARTSSSSPSSSPTASIPTRTSRFCSASRTTCARRVFTNPHREGERRLWYATAIGTEPSIADVIIDATEQFDAEHFSSVKFGPQKRDLAIYHSLMSCVVEMLARSVTRHGTEISTDPYQIGQVLVLFTLDGHLEVRHFEDAKESGTDLGSLKSLADLRDVILRASDGSFRPLRAAPNLQRGWTMTVGNINDLHALQEVLDYLYPAAIANWSLWKDGSLPVTPWH